MPDAHDIAGGPSELAALGLLPDAPPSYWHKWSTEAVARIRPPNTQPPKPQPQPCTNPAERCHHAGKRLYHDTCGSEVKRPRGAYYCPHCGWGATWTTHPDHHEP